MNAIEAIARNEIVLRWLWYAAGCSRNRGWAQGVLACRVLGHRWRFSAQGATMRWTCARGCGAGGDKRYESAERAARYARAFDRDDRDDLGRRPLLSLLPLGLARRARRDGGARGR